MISFNHTIVFFFFFLINALIFFFQPGTISVDSKKTLNNFGNPEESSSSSPTSNDTHLSTFSCHECGSLMYDTKMYVAHLELVHHLINYFSCPIEECFRTYNTAPAIKYHLEHSHKLVQSKEIRRNSAAIDSCHQMDTEIYTIKSSDNDDILENPPCAYKPDYISAFTDNINQSAEFFGLNDNFCSEVEKIVAFLYDIINISRSIVQTIYSLVKSLTNNFAN